MPPAHIDLTDQAPPAVRNGMERLLDDLDLFEALLGG